MALPPVALVPGSARCDSGTVTIGGAGRTDAGVHALAQVAHADLAKEWPANTVLNALNFHLQPEPVAQHGGQPRRLGAQRGGGHARVEQPRELEAEVAKIADYQTRAGKEYRRAA